MTIHDDFNLYTDSIGLVQNRLPDPEGATSGNGILFTADASMVLAQNNSLDDEFIKRSLNALFICEVESGLYRRHPFNQEQESIDDILGIAVISKLFNKPQLAKDILQYGRTHWGWAYGFIPLRYYYATEVLDRFDERAWLGRFIVLFHSLKLAAGEKPNWLERLAFWWSIRYEEWQGETSPILSWLQVNNFGNDSDREAFYKRLYKKYPEGMKQVFTLYFEKNHPIAKYVLK